ncbi:SRPBCC family protein [Demequina silvatica]|uniref:SRPBCC family protein n=1 Tax=Demequina silvatica TaxID=1638988 RepID=UPI0009E4F54E|nr:SRPBCC family protein [Demequina silvatica]
MTQSVAIDIAAPPDRVWAVLSDVDHWPEWTPTVTSVIRSDDAPLHVGTHAKVAQPRLADADYAVTELDPGHSFTWVATHPGLATTARHEVDPLPDGGTHVTLSITQSGLLGPLMGRVYRGLTDRYLHNEANGLKARCEAAA